MLPPLSEPRSSASRSVPAALCQPLPQNGRAAVDASVCARARLPSHSRHPYHSKAPRADRSFSCLSVLAATARFAELSVQVLQACPACTLSRLFLPLSVTACDGA